MLVSTAHLTTPPTQRAASSQDLIFLEVLYRCLADAHATRDLLALDGPHLQPFLTSAAGLGAGGQGVGPLSKEQVGSGLTSHP